MKKLLYSRILTAYYFWLYSSYGLTVTDFKVNFLSPYRMPDGRAFLACVSYMGGPDRDELHFYTHNIVGRHTPIHIWWNQLSMHEKFEFFL